MNNKDKGTFIDKNGFFKLMIKPGEYKFVLFSLLYEEFITDLVKIQANVKLNVNIFLIPSEKDKTINCK